MMSRPSSSLFGYSLSLCVIYYSALRPKHKTFRQIRFYSIAFYSILLCLEWNFREWNGVFFVSPSILCNSSKTCVDKNRQRVIRCHDTWHEVHWTMTTNIFQLVGTLAHNKVSKKWKHFVIITKANKDILPSRLKYQLTRNTCQEVFFDECC